MGRTAIVLQARLGSRRLPGKVLAKIGSRTVLEHCVIRLAESGLPIIVATTDRPEDDPIEREARRLGVDVFRGEEHNVLARFLGAARAFDLDRIVRATADNPLVDADGPRRVVEVAERLSADHVVECGLPIGAGVEAVSVDALTRALALIVDDYDREHVTTFLKRDARFRSISALAPTEVRSSGLRLTVDTQDDLDFIRAIAASLGTIDGAPRLADVIWAAQRLQTAAQIVGRTVQGA